MGTAGARREGMVGSAVASTVMANAGAVAAAGRNSSDEAAAAAAGPGPLYAPSSPGGSQQELDSAFSRVKWK